MAKSILKNLSWQADPTPQYAAEPMAPGLRRA